MAERNKISIITVSLNSAHTIERTILSVLGQRGCDFEYIIIDGGSDDGTVDIIKKYENRLAYWVSEPDGGIYDAMNKGVGVATGEIVAFLNSDDYYLETDCLQRMTALFVADPTMDIIAGRMVVIDENDLIIGYSINRELETLCYKMAFAHPATFVKRYLFDRIGRFRTEYRIAADYDWLLRAYHCHCRIMTIDDVLVSFSFTGVSSTNKSLMAKERYEVSLVSNPPEALEKHRGTIEMAYQDLTESWDKTLKLRESISNNRDETRREILALLGQPSDICIFGCGFMGSECFGMLKQLAIKCHLIIDNDKSKWQEGAEVRVAPPSALADFQGTVIISVTGKEDEIVQQINMCYNDHCYKIVSYQSILDIA
jgi:glycosyltransferase involved in cell wall biosynthesis